MASYQPFIMMGVHSCPDVFLLFSSRDRDSRRRTKWSFLEGIYLGKEPWGIEMDDLKITKKSCLKVEKSRFAPISFTKHYTTVFSDKSVQHLDRAEIDPYKPTVKQKYLQTNNCKGSFKPM